MSDIGLRVLISGVAEARRDLRSVQGDVSGLENTIQRLSQTSSRIGQTLSNVGREVSRLGITLSTTLTAGIVAAGTALTNAGVQFEDGFAGITKTVDGLAVGFDEIRDAAERDLGLVVTNMDEARAAAEVLGMEFGTLTELGQATRDEFRLMALEVPIPTTELLRLGEVVGQLGVGQEDIAEVTRLISLLGVTTDISAEEAAFGIIRFGNIMQGTMLDVEDFTKRAGSAIVALGNSSVSTEGEILNLALRLAAAGDRAKFSEQEILAWATTLTDLGTRAELGGSAVSRVINEMLLAVNTGGEGLEEFAAITGQSVEEFSKAFEDDASAAVLNFIEKLEAGIAGDDGAVAISKEQLTALGLGGIRVIDVIGRLGDATDLYTGNLETANVAWAEAIALEEEAEKRFKTVKSQIQLTKNALTDLGIVIFDLAKDKMERFLAGIRELIERFKKLTPAQQRLIVQIATFAAVLGPVLIIVGTFISLLGTVVTALAAVSLPMLGIIGLLGLLGVALVSAIGKENIFNFLQKQASSFETNFSRILAGIKEFIDGFIEDARFAFGVFAGFLQPNGDSTTALQGFVKRIQRDFDKIGESIEYVLSVFALLDIGTLFADAGIDEAFLGVLSELGGLLRDISEIAIAEIEIALTNLATNFGAAAGTNREKISGFFDSITTHLDDLKEFIALSREVLTGEAPTSLAPANEVQADATSGEPATGIARFIPPETLESLKTALSTIHQLIAAFQTLSTVITTQLGPPIKEAFDTLTATLNDMGFTWKDVFDSIVKAVGIAIAIIIFTIGLVIVVIAGLVVGIARAAKAITETWRKAAPLWGSFFTGFMRILAGVGVLIKAEIDRWIAAFNFVKSALSGDVEGMKQAITDWGNTWALQWQGVKSVLLGAWDIIKSTVFLIIVTIEGLVKVLIGLFGGLIETVILFFTNLKEELVGGSIIPEMAEMIIAVIRGLKDRFIRAIQELLFSVIEKFVLLKDGVIAEILEMKDRLVPIIIALKRIFTLFEDTINRVLDTVTTAATGIVEAMQSILEGITDSPTLSIQHPFEAFEQYLKTADFSFAVMGQALSSPLATAGGYVQNTSKESNTNNSLTVNATGVPIQNETDLTRVIERQWNNLQAWGN